jgi:hypothetical protein
MPQSPFLAIVLGPIKKLPKELRKKESSKTNDSAANQPIDQG